MNIPSSCNLPDGRIGGYECVIRDSNGDGRTEDIFECVAKTPLEGEGIIRADYLIMTVVYAPPGSEGCANPSTVAYGNGSSVGTTVSVSDSVAENTKITVSGGVEVLGTGANASISFEKGMSQASSDSMTVTLSSNSTINGRGPCTDGVDHDEDQIWLHLGAEVVMHSKDPAGCSTCAGRSVAWTLNGGVGENWPVTVGELKGTHPMNPEIAAALARHGVTSDDFPAILSADPFAFEPGDVTIVPDWTRFVPVPGTFAYLVDDGGSTASRDWDMSTGSDLTTGSESSHKYTVGASVEAKGGFGGFASAALKVEGGLTWSSSNSASSTDRTSTSAVLHMGIPSSGYTGPMAYYAYYDTVYKSYAFIPVGR
jgi:hypothetical protein